MSNSQAVNEMGRISEARSRQQREMELESELEILREAELEKLEEIDRLQQEELAKLAARAAQIQAELQDQEEGAVEADISRVIKAAESESSAANAALAEIEATKIQKGQLDRSAESAVKR